MPPPPAPGSSTCPQPRGTQPGTPLHSGPGPPPALALSPWPQTSGVFREAWSLSKAPLNHRAPQMKRALQVICHQGIRLKLVPGQRSSGWSTTWEPSTWLGPRARCPWHVCEDALLIAYNFWAHNFDERLSGWMNEGWYQVLFHKQVPVSHTQLT